MDSFQTLNIYTLPNPSFTIYIKVGFYISSQDFDSKLYLVVVESNKSCEKMLTKFSDARKLCCNLPKTQTRRPKLKVF